MQLLYSNQKNVQILISLLKAFDIHNVIVSPGVKNISFVGSIQNDAWFKLYSCVDERSAAYMACGIASETKQPVVLTCTEATAPRNYFPGLTEAFYRKLPIIAVTSTWADEMPGHMFPQCIDQSVSPNDTFKYSCELPVVDNSNDSWVCSLLVNHALNELDRAGGGPIRIGLRVQKEYQFTEKTLPKVRVIKRYYDVSNVAKELKNKRIGIFVGAHLPWSEELVEAVGSFCANFNAVVICDHTSNYYGASKILYPLIGSQDYLDKECLKLDIMIHIGEVIGSYTVPICDYVWRVNEDGEIRDPFRKLNRVFQMSEYQFFSQICFPKPANTRVSSVFKLFKSLDDDIRGKIPALPFSNIWIASRMSTKIPEGAALHLAILNSLRSWNFFELKKKADVYCNVGGFGIDGCMSSFLGASFVNQEKLYFGVFGDLSFFYDLNSLANWHVGNNVRIVLINNGRGVEFRNYNNAAERYYGDNDIFMAAAGHFGNQSKTLVKDYCTSLGIQYLSAHNKSEFEEASDILFSKDSKQAILLEAFTNAEDESNALKILRTIQTDKKTQMKTAVKKTIESTLGPSGTALAKKFITR